MPACLDRRCGENSIVDDHAVAWMPLPVKCSGQINNGLIYRSGFEFSEKEEGSRFFLRTHEEDHFGSL